MGCEMRDGVPTRNGLANTLISASAEFTHEFAPEFGQSPLDNRLVKGMITRRFKSLGWDVLEEGGVETTDQSQTVVLSRKNVILNVYFLLDKSEISQLIFFATEHGVDSAGCIIVQQVANSDGTTNWVERPNQRLRVAD